MKNGFTTKSLKTQTLSEILHESRFKHDLSLEKLSRLLNIKKDYLEALESGQYNELPAEVYTKGYLKSLSDFLHLNFDLILSLYKKERNIEKQIKKSKEPIKYKPKKSSSFVITPRTFRIIFVVLIILGLLSYLWYEFSGLSRPPKLYISEPAFDKTIKSDVITLTGQTDPEVVLSVNSQPIHIDSWGNFSEKISLQKGLNILKVQAQNRLGKVNTIERKIVVEKPKKSAEEREKEEVMSAGVELIVTIKEKGTWLHVKTDDKVAYSGTMLSDSRQVFRAKEKIILSSGKASATYVIFNGKDLGALKAEGDVIRDMEFNKETAVE